MKVIRNPVELPRRLASLGFVPTMGAFHEGHLELMRVARRQCEQVAVSIFVNPTQFAPTEDLSRYPRPEARDLELAESVGVDYMFLPSVETMYPRNSTTVQVRGVSERWEGEFRPGHFDGVATVVAKLFHLVGPTEAFFGRKDFQQCAVIRRMVEDLNFDLKLNWVDTFREKDGLAMSSRNQYLSAHEREIAPQLHRTLCECVDKLLAGNPIPETINRYHEQLTQYGFRPQYLAVVDTETLESLEQLARPATLIVSAYLGTTRLIDNLAIA